MEPKPISGSEALAFAWILSLSRESEGTSAHIWPFLVGRSAGSTGVVLTRPLTENLAVEVLFQVV